MTEHRSFKKLVRARMAKTGESYTAARAQLLAAAGPEPVLVTTDERIRERTGRGWEDWFDLLDGEGLTGRPHREISRRLAAIMDLPPLAWNVQAVTKSFERARGGKAVGEKDDGFSITVTRTLPAPPERVFDLLADPARRREWLDAELTERTSTRPRRVRFDHPDGRVAITVEPKDVRSVLAVEHSRLADAALAAKTKAWWRDRLSALATLLERSDV